MSVVVAILKKERKGGRGRAGGSVGKETLSRKEKKYNRSTRRHTTKHSTKHTATTHLVAVWMCARVMYQMGQMSQGRGELAVESKERDRGGEGRCRFNVNLG